MLRVGMIGCGGMGRDHIKRLTGKIQGAEVVAVTDVSEENAKAAAALCGAKIYRDGYDLIHAPEVDAVFIVSPGFAHKEHLLQAIDAGKRVFCEKPLCTTAEDCLEVVKAEEASGKHLIQLGFMRRYDRGYRQVKAAIQ
ncbi:Gfo/Idh/MocA family oxidoreductase [Lachnospiraceae bacterium 54-53]